MSINSALQVFGLIKREVNLLLTSYLRAYSLGIGPKQAIMLAHIQKTPKSSHAHLARATSTDPAAVGRAIDSLVNQGYLEREEHPSDKRQWVLLLSKKGRELMRPINKIISEISDDFIEPLSSKERAQFKELLEKVHKHLEEKTAKE